MEKLEIEQLVYKDINFTYPNKKCGVRNVNCVFEKGKITAIIGENGSGKSTLVNLPLNIWNNYTGEILINDKNISNLNRTELLSLISLCFQKTPLFYDSILNNIILDNPMNTHLNDLLKKIGLFDYISSLPKGINTLVGEVNNLSGGQIQKIGILRTLYAQKPIMFFDEPTSSLDGNSKELFLNLLNEYKENHIIVIVSHDDYIIMRCDEIFKLQ